MANLQIQKIIEQLNQLSIEAKTLKTIEEKLATQQFNLVIIGQFKRGKSTLINAILKKPILPTSVLPLTSIITIISYGSNPYSIVKFIDDSKKQIDLDEIELYVTEKHNPNNQLKVKQVDILYPCDFLKHLRIIDTPGIGSIYQHNSDVSYSFLPSSDAAVFVLSPDPPLTQAEIDFLKDAKDYISKFFFVLNKIDNFNKQDLLEVIEFNKKTLEGLLSTNIQIIPISAKLALEAALEDNAVKIKESNIEELYNYLKSFMEKEQSIVFMQSIINSLLRFTQSQLNYYKLQESALNISKNELSEKILLFEDAIKKLNPDDYIWWLDKKTKDIVNQLDEDIAVLKSQHLVLLSDRMLDFFEKQLKHNQSSAKLDSSLKEYLSNHIQSIFSDFVKIQSEKIAKSLEEVYVEALAKVNELIEKIIQTASNIFNVKLARLSSIEQLSQKSEFYFLIEEQPGALDILGNFFKTNLPLFISKPIIKRSIIKRTAELFDRHCGRVRYDFVKRIKETTLKFNSQLSDMLSDTNDTLKNILNQALSQQDDLSRKKAADLIKEKITNLNDILSQLETLKTKGAT